MRGEMKLNTRANIYQASNVAFDPETETGTSYGWWIFVKRIDGKLVFNDYFYSPTTARHQVKMRRLLEELGIKIDLEIEAPRGIQSLGSAVDFYIAQIQKLEALISKPGTKREKNKERREQIRTYKLKLRQVVKMYKGVAA